MTGADLQTVLDYHRRTKHRPGAYARSAGYLDWDNQPAAFRFYPGPAPIRLPLLAEDPAPASDPAPLTVETIGGLLELSLGLSAWKYGERAWRYCQLDVGHALAALKIAAGFFGWQATVLEAVSDEAASRVLGLDRTVWPPGEDEAAELMVWIHPRHRPPPRLDLPEPVVAAFGGLEIIAAPSRLSPSHVDWDLITSVAAACRRPADVVPEDPHGGPSDPDLFPAAGITPALVRRRRSGQAYDAGASIPLAMIAEFEDPVARFPHRYRELFWICGQMGQALYLAAEAQGLGGTGIGCFFDDEVHRCLGLGGERFQCLYQFALGRPIPDPRVATRPPYLHRFQGGSPDGP
jgi:nitroreductase